MLKNSKLCFKFTILVACLMQNKIGTASESPLLTELELIDESLEDISAATEVDDGEDLDLIRIFSPDNLDNDKTENDTNLRTIASNARVNTVVRNTIASNARVNTVVRNTIASNARVNTVVRNTIASNIKTVISAIRPSSLDSHDKWNVECLQDHCDTHSSVNDSMLRLIGRVLLGSSEIPLLELPQPSVRLEANLR